MIATMTQDEYKVGDRVRHLGYNLCGIITDFLGEGFVKVRAIDDDVFSTWDINNLELCDRKTAFLRKLGALLREFDAKIEICADYGYSAGLSLILNGERVIHDKEVTELIADNIMNFDKE